jgi:hypothetical protein
MASISSQNYSSENAFLQAQSESVTKFSVRKVPK